MMTHNELSSHGLVALTDADLAEINGGGPILVALGIAAVAGGVYLVGYGIGYVKGKIDSGQW